MAIRIVKGGNRLVKDDVHDAVVDDIEERREDEDKHYLRWSFELTRPGPHQGIRLSGLTSALLDENTDLDQWLKAILGRRIEHGEEMDIDAAVTGRPCRVRTVTETRDNGRRYSNVVEVLAPRA